MVSIVLDLTTSSMSLDALPVCSLAPSDEVLVERARAGDEAAFGELVARYQGRVYRLGLRLAGDPADAEEILQETFVQVFKGLGGFRGESRFSTWLYRVGANCALMHRRARRRRQLESLDSYLPDFDAHGRHARLDVDYSAAARIEETYERRQLAAAAMAGLDRLPEAYRAVFVLRDLEELSTAEVAALLQLEPAAVRQRLHRARLMLRGYLGRLVGEP